MYEQDPIISEGVICSLTKRVMIISPLPDRVRSLLVMLSAECFDVFSLHDFNKSMLPALQPELLVYDALPIAQPTGGHTLRGGTELLRAAAEHQVPVLVLMDKQTYDERGDADVSGAELLVWPAKPEEALERINAMLANSTALPGSIGAEDELTFKDITIDLRKMKVMQGATRIDLTKTEYDLLMHFMNSDGSVLSRETLLDAVWGLQFYGSSNVVDVHIKSLRKKLRDSAVSPKYIVTVRGAGYRLADEPIH
ncbi:response regulator transcription factor [Paenibacillus sp. GSMTC-2017]|uniref:response regulator transcription factor n=1 Tax=Paenibacillus sp. GSMTC-2017 TaxID=2794350 RepID=UPI0018D808FA|nr:response regulator transcription factor [Paenibacillus sp. GSMTC-2017]MBH5319817.1 response regulator transcription factor [Paenibacillus sp. GSMTC-2017]